MKCNFNHSRSNIEEEVKLNGQKVNKTSRFYNLDILCKLKKKLKKMKKKCRALNYTILYILNSD